MCPSRSLIWLAVLSVVVWSGCIRSEDTSAPEKKADTPPKAVWPATWPELESLLYRPPESPVPDHPSIGASDDDLRWKWFGSPEFRNRLKKFSETPIPAHFATAEREAGKRELVRACERLLEALSVGDKRARDLEVENGIRAYQKVIGPRPAVSGDDHRYAPVK